MTGVGAEKEEPEKKLWVPIPGQHPVCIYAYIYIYVSSEWKFAKLDPGLDFFVRTVSGLKIISVRLAACPEKGEILT